MSMRPDPMLSTCATCDLDLPARPVLHVGLAFCCSGCAADGPCICSYDDEDERAMSDPPARVELSVHRGVLVLPGR